MSAIQLICVYSIIQRAQFSEKTEALYPNFGYLYPESTKELRKVFNDTTVRAALEPYSKYLQLFDQVGLGMQVEMRDWGEVTLAFPPNEG